MSEKTQDDRPYLTIRQCALYDLLFNKYGVSMDNDSLKKLDNAIDKYKRECVNHNFPVIHITVRKPIQWKERFILDDRGLNL